MSANQTAAQDARSAEAGKRRKRKERAARTRTPEAKEIVSGAGQPLDVSVRRELEERLGHDFSRVRLHTDRDAGALAEMLGADALAVGQDIFFREGTYRPGTADGQRLLAHELLHTVQNPDGLGTLRAGRDLGAVSLPQEAIEREAETAAQDSVRDTAQDSARGFESAPDVKPGQATPGWLRYATVDADRNRLEQIDPATLVDRLTNSVARSLRSDPQDLSKRTRKQLARLPDELLDGVLERLESRLLSSEHERVLDLVDEVETDDGTDADNDLERDSHAAPAIEPDMAEELRFERETEQRSVQERREEEQKADAAQGPEKGRPGSASADGSTSQSAKQQRKPGADAGHGSKAQHPGTAPPAAAVSQQPVSSPEAAPAAGQDVAPDQDASAGQSASSDVPSGQNESPEAGQEVTEQQGVPVASEEESAAKNRPDAVDALVAGQQVKPEDKAGSPQPTGSPAAPVADLQPPGTLSTLDGVRAQDLGGPQEKADEDPFGSGSGSEVDVGGGEPSAWDIKLQPEDFLPTQDLDVSSVPTADEGGSGSAAMPSFPAPPVTKAEEVQAERDAEDAQDAAAEPGTGPDDTTADVGPSAQADKGVSGGDEAGDPAVQQAVTAPASSTTSADPTSGADPKAGPVAAQMTVQQASGGTSEGGSGVKEQAAEQEKGTAAGGEVPGAAQAGAPQQAVGGTSAPPEPAIAEAQRQTDSAPAGRNEPTADSNTPSPARDTHISGGSNADTPGGASSNAASRAHGASRTGSQAKSEAGSRTQAPAAKAPTPAAPQASNAPGAPAALAPQEAPAAPTAAAPKAAPVAEGPPPGGGGGGGGQASRASAPAKGSKDRAPAPNLSQVSPEAGLATASNLKPHLALQAMTGVSGSVDRTVGDQHKALAAAPPSMQRPAGAPQTLQGQPKADAPAQYSQDPAQKSEAPAQQKAEVTGAKQPDGPIEAEKAEPPSGWQTFKMALGFGLGKVASWLGFKVDPQELAAKFAGLPTKDEALKQAQAGNAPGVQMQAAAEQTAGQQGAAVDTKGQETIATGRDDAARPMGEDQVYPDAPKDQMTAKVPGQQGGQGGAPATDPATGAVPPEAASEVAEHERGPQFQAVFSQGRKGISEGRQTKDRDFRDSQLKHKQQVDAEVAKNTKSQADERAKALDEVTDHRADWRSQQDGELKKLGDKKTQRHEKVRQDVKDKEEGTDKDVAKEKDDGDKKIQDETTEAENDAENTKNDSVKESGNWVTKAFDWIKQKVIEIKNAIVRIIKQARDAVVGFIKNFKETVERWINEARKWIVDTIKDLINDLIDFARAMVQAVIDLANRIRKLITSLIQAAIALVNKLSAMLKQIVTDLLNALGKLLSGILDLLKQLLQAAIKDVVDGIKAVLDFASKLLNALGQWMLIAVDFLSDPGGWLSGLKNSAVDGAEHHLFAEVSSAVKQWFKDKIQEIIGVPKAIFDELLNGGFSLDEIVKEAWEAVLPQLPLIIGELVMTKVVAKLIPGAGWVMAVIDFLQTAWSALSAILQALTTVLDWLKAVRVGGAGILFAKAVASGVVALLEVLYQWLLNSVRKYVSKVGKRLKGVAAKLFKRKGEGGEGAHREGAGGEGTGGEGDKGATGGAEKPQEQAPKKPGTESDPNKPATHAPNEDAAPGKPKEPADGKPDTRPTPSAKPEPKPETRPKSEPKPKDDAPGKPKDETPGKPKGKDGEKNGSGKPKNGKDDDPKRPKRDEGDKPRKPKPDEHEPRRPKNKPDKEGPGRPKSKRDKDKRKKKEDSNDSKEERLQKIIARIRPRLESLLDKGTPEIAFRGVLRGMRAWYRLTDLSAVGREDFRVIATLNPQGLATRGEFETFALGDYEDKVVTEIRNAIEAQVRGEHDLRCVIDKCTGIGDAILAKHRKAAQAQHGNQGPRQATKKDSGRRTRPRLGDLQWKPDRSVLDGIVAREFPDSVFLNYVRPASGKLPAETIHIGQFRKDQSTLVESERRGDQAVYKDPRFPLREYVKSETGSYVPRKVQRALAKRDMKPGKRGISAPAPDLTPSPEMIGAHVQGAPGGANGEKQTPFTSTTKIDAKDLTNAQGVRLGGGYGLVSIDLLHVSPSQIYDLTGAAEQEYYELANPLASQRQALQDVVRTQEVLIHGTIPKTAITRLED